MVKIVNSLSEIPKKGIVIIDFFATWCGPCKRIAPMFESISNEYADVTFLKVDVDEADGIASEYDLTALPTFVCLKDGKEVGRVEGADLTGLGAMLEKLVGN